MSVFQTLIAKAIHLGYRNLPFCCNVDKLHHKSN